MSGVRATELDENSRLKKKKKQTKSKPASGMTQGATIGKAKWN
jgi:hypothetical protein